MNLTRITRYRLDVLIIIGVFLITFGIRTFPSDAFPNIYGFDSYWGSRMTKYMITGEKGNFPFDCLLENVTDHPWGRGIRCGGDIGWWGINAVIYKFTGGAAAPFNFDHFGFITSWMTAIVGSLAVVGIYAFGRIAFNRTTGLFAALLLSISGNHLFYSIFGHAENDALGLTLFFFTLTAFAYNSKKFTFGRSILSFLLFSWLSVVWMAYSVSALIIAGTVAAFYGIAIFAKFMSNRQFIENSEVQRLNLTLALIPILLSVFTRTVLFKSPPDPISLGAIAVTAVSAILLERFYITKNGLRFTKQDKLTLSLAIITVSLGITTIFYGIDFLGAAVSFVTSPAGVATGLDLPYEQRMWQTIAEQNPIGGGDLLGRINTLSGTFGITIWLAFIGGLVAFGKTMFNVVTMRKSVHIWDITASGFILFALQTLTQKSITMFFLAGTIAFGAAYLLSEVIRVIPKFFKNQQYKKHLLLGAYFFSIAIFLSGSLGISNAAQSFGYDVPQEWFETFDFLNTVQKDSVITAWWDYGHWMNYWNGGQIYTTLDNIQDRMDIIFTVASSFTHAPQCAAEQTNPQDPRSIRFNCPIDAGSLEQAELESLSLLKPLKTTHILIDKEIVAGFTGGKFGALAHIAGVQTGCFQQLGCSKQEGGISCTIGTDGQGNPLGMTFTSEQWKEAVEQKFWPSGIDSADYGLSGIDIRAFAKEDSQGQQLFMPAIGCGSQFTPNTSPPILFDFAHRLWLKDPNLKHVKLVFENDWNVIYEIIDQNTIPEPTEFTAWTKQNSVLCTGNAKIICDKLANQT
ncbi:MAG: hypothetical protein J4432_02710 [DPANN group archaeon]|nr:hypothetical protein [DPANN group archaeon]